MGAYENERKQKAAQLDEALRWLDEAAGFIQAAADVMSAAEVEGPPMRHALAAYDETRAAATMLAERIGA